MDLKKLDPKKNLIDACLLSAAKWKYIVLNGGAAHKIYVCLPELQQLPSGCGFCKRYSSFGADKCKKCEIAKKDKPCDELGSIFNNWHKAPIKSSEELMFAKLMLCLIRQIYNEAVRKGK